MGKFVDFMLSTPGRALRMLLGVAMLSYGFLAEQSVIVGVLGIIPIVTGGINACLIAPLFGRTVWGKPRSGMAH